MTRPALIALALSACAPPQAQEPPTQAVAADPCADGTRPAWMGDDAAACRWMARLEAEFGKDLEGGAK